MAKVTWEEKKQKLAEVRELLQSRDNHQWYIKRWMTTAWGYIGVLCAVWQVPGMIGITLSHYVFKIIFIVLILLIFLITRESSRFAIRGYLHKRVEIEAPGYAGCSVEIRVADNYLTNAFYNYPGSSMMIGINKAFWFQEAAPNSLIADMWKELEKRGIDKTVVQQKIDEALKKLDHEKNIDSRRQKVKIKRSSEKTEEQFVIRDNYKIGTIVGVDLCWEDPEKYVLTPMYRLIPGAIGSSFIRFKYRVTMLINRMLRVEGENDPGMPKRFMEYIKSERMKKIPSKKQLKKLYLIANSEIVQGRDGNEPMRVISDKHAPVAEHFENIWKYFETDENMTEEPPECILYTPLLLPLIGAGVANEGYTDLEIFSQLVDLYYKHVRQSVMNGTRPAIPQMIINIRNKTAIENDKKIPAEGRKIDIQTAFWYLDYRNQVNPPQNALED